jgi:hypothetical protein
VTKRVYTLVFINAGNILQFHAESFQTALELVEIITPIIDNIYDGKTEAQLYIDTGTRCYKWIDEETGIEDVMDYIEYKNEVID